MLMLDEPIHVVPYDPGWTDEFVREQARLSRVLAVPFERIAHIGSTAVPTLAAKPIIDIMIGADRLPPSADLIVKAGTTLAVAVSGGRIWRTGKRRAAE